MVCGVVDVDSVVWLESYKVAGSGVGRGLSIFALPVDPCQLAGAQRPGRGSSLFTVGWTEVAAGSDAGPALVAVLGDDIAGAAVRYAGTDELEQAVAGGATVPDGVLAGGAVTGPGGEVAAP